MKTLAKINKGRLLTILIMALCLFAPTLIFGQPTIAPLKVGQQGQLKFGASAQMWARYTELNPGSTIQGEAMDHVSDVSIRRFRAYVCGQVTERWYVKFQLGANNLNYLNNNSTLKILDLEASYRFADAFELGGGKNAYVGLSRYAAPASSSALGFDLAFFAMPTVGITDDILRKFSVYAKGEIGPIAYRAVVARPMAVQNAPALGEQASFQDNFPSPQYSGYVSYQFFDRESQTSAFRVATYHGAKKLMSIGGGFMYQEDALAGLENLDTVSYNMKHFALDFFLDMPLNASNTRSVTAYAGYFNYDYGKDYIRLVGVNNTANGVAGGTYNKAGNKFPAIGTGEIFYGQAGYRMAFANHSQIPALQAFAAIQYAEYDGLDEQMIVYDYGINLLFNGHKSKLTFGIQNRPIYEQKANEKIEICDRMNMYVIQYQIKI
ncbi:hypothetical protein [Reichenbachiella ulvae]|uniref:Short chain amide porin n=1 Tax=Reichenbachiella ulvae TaxID=2980104 RepID=A0ABT3CTJ1_9BACT|nr:hypothetical protein [Reichenbachiella ulvae]MCV9386873.1 hypothetical protein [Reichenbachiella ulvae]